MKDYDMKYCEYFNIDEKYSPCIDESAINKGVDWERTYPHESFIKLLNMTEKMLGGVLNHSIWIYGAYGTGKSLCAYTLKRILEVSSYELRAYWKKYDALSKKPELLEKLIGHKEQGILTVYRYASGSISNSQQLFFAIQESVKQALKDNDVDYKGESSLKENIISWLESPQHSIFIDALLKDNQKWASLFPQSSTQEIITALKKNGDVTSLIKNIFALAAEEGITALTLKGWLADIVKKNNLKIVFVWDEFSDFFRKNSDSLSDFQDVISIYQEAPVYFVVVTHPVSSLAKRFSFSESKDDPWNVTRQRFEDVEISLPDNIAFNLIYHAFDVKEAAKPSWKKVTKDLSSSVDSSSGAVSKAIKLQNADVIQNILPIHPMAALVLKNIASAFQSNQRSMFDFIKTSQDTGVEGFQWFIKQTGPFDDRPLFTVDMLWNFFYEYGKDYLSQDIRMILDTFEQRSELDKKEQVVLKTILIMESIDKRLNGALPILKPTNQNLSYAFEGDFEEYANECKSIAQGLCKKGVLNEIPIDGGKKVYTTATLAGDNLKIDTYKKEIAEKSTIEKLVLECPGIGEALELKTNPALNLRFALNTELGRLPVVTITNFNKTMNTLKDKPTNWRFYAVLALAKTETEAQEFRKMIKEAVKNEVYKNITIIDALSTPLGVEDFNSYVEFSARAMTYDKNRTEQAGQYAQKSKDVLEKGWKKRINEGQFIVYTYRAPDGDKAMGADGVYPILQSIVRSRFKHILDFEKGLNEAHLKFTQKPAAIARIGMGDVVVKGTISGCEKIVLGKVWGKENYWLDEKLAGEHIVIIKREVDEMISAALKSSGKISIEEIYYCLENKFGFSPCNLSAFLTGFLLKEYAKEPYRYMDEEGLRKPLDKDQLAEMIALYFTKFNGKIPKSAYIVNLNREEKAFYELTSTVWDIPEEICSSPDNTGFLVAKKMRENLGYPVWCLEEIDNVGIYDVVNLYIELIRNNGNESHDIANSIGKAYINRPSIAKSLKFLLTSDNCIKGMMQFLSRFEEGVLLLLAKEIDAENSVLSDIKKRYSVKYAALWDRAVGEDEIRKIIVEYSIVKRTNLLLNVATNSKDDAFNAWREQLKFIGFSCEAIISKRPKLNDFFSALLHIANSKDFLPEKLKSFLEEMTEHLSEIKDILDNSTMIFSEIYSPYLNGIAEYEIEEVKNSVSPNLFIQSETSANAIVKKTAEDYKNSLLKTQLLNLWKKNTKTKTPRAWSDEFHMPILCCISADDYTKAKKAFAALNSNAPSDADVKEALEYLKGADFFDNIANPAFRDECFVREVIQDYASLLPDIEIVKDCLLDTGIPPYEWNENPAIKTKIIDMALAEYNAGGSDQAVEVVDNMSDSELKKWLKEIIKRDMGLGVKIIINKKE